ncbi:carbohydrate ABC transporter membrane protein 1, CUT1 family [Kaistia soli DSM 19436]|uniref:Carbohydrate ABC transporter membrane protein 1, CUT1 family n=1 Tax=Kaistia soli DSM 19436 TaxID=1122133 RepID=A0A1M5DYS4_9HYPH|nr:sugar ABC transporter permease [Kaistia soli]SHF72178.1 carbohydrate ABC transporter membrane protein 1, CUT1 family [Kaistia soli DSM 19436]
MTDVTANIVSAAPAGSTTRRGYWSGVARDGRKLGLWFVAPTLVLLLFIVIFPMGMQLYLSATWWTPLDGTPWYLAFESFNGGENYLRLVTDPGLWSALWRTVLIMAVAVPVQFMLGLGLAFLFIDQFPGRKIFYSILLTPMMIVPAVVGMMFYLLFQGTGPINNTFGLPASFSWLADVNRAMISVIIADVWQWTPLMFLILLAGMLGVPQDQLLAARLLGGSNWQNFRKIILPRMKPVIAIALVLRSVECFKIFDLIYIMTKGGPGVQTETISLYLYKQTFADLDWSYVAAIGLTILLVLSLAAARGLAYNAKKRA